jgi:hypothetical protein
MKIKDLPKNTNLRYVRVRIPEHIEIPQFGTAPQREVYLRGWMWNSMMVSLSPEDQRIYPILRESDYMEWEVVDEKYLQTN